VITKGRFFYLVFGILTLLAALPFWLTRLLPMQDYSNFLVFARVFGDCRDPSSPFSGTYAVGFPLSPLVLPILTARAIARFTDFETAGRVMWTLYAVGLPLATLNLLRVLGRDRWAVLLTFPLLMSYWVIGGFFSFTTSTPLLFLGLALTVRWLEEPSRRNGVLLAVVVAACHLWHALGFAEMLFGFGVLWLLARFDSLEARARALLPLVPALGLFASWVLTTIQGHPPGSRPAAWPPFFDNASRFFEYVGPIVPEGVGAIMLLGLLVAAGALARSASPAASPADRRASAGLFRVSNPFAVLSLLAVVLYVILPATWLGVEGLNNRQPWLAALLFVPGWTLPSRPAARALLLALVGGAGVLALVHMARRFAAFDRETIGASRLIDRLEHGDTMLAPVGTGSTVSFPGKPLVALELYASVRHGSLPNGSFAGYVINLIRYVNDRNPMPGLGGGWLDSPALRRFDYVLLRAPGNLAVSRPEKLQAVSRDGDWALYAVCGSKKLPHCK
jgi:hypothetical protein